ncbi:MAG: hypothetical protein JRJ20_09585 [Deltaproteobacteria bacterium]|nr:hypothetical protein [Deltaproteobacteria bacterium]
MTGWKIKGSMGAAQTLGLKPPTLYSRMKKLGIKRTSRGRNIDLPAKHRPVFFLFL